MTIPKGTLFPMCGMNLAFDRDLIWELANILRGNQFQTIFDQFRFMKDGLVILSSSISVSLIRANLLRLFNM
ncbi:unnamed protein product [Arabidopsis halleri]